jgi:hypothetical protein
MRRGRIEEGGTHLIGISDVIVWFVCVCLGFWYKVLVEKQGVAKGYIVRYDTR